MNYMPVRAGAEGVTEVAGTPGLRVSLASTPATFSPDGMTLTAGTVTAGLLSDVGLGRLVIKGNASYYMLDYAATQHVASPDPTDASSYTVLGVGLRIGFRGMSVSGKAQFSLGALAASASLSATATAFEAQAVGVGLNLASVPFVEQLIASALASFDVSSLQTIGAAFAQLGDYLAIGGGSITPKAIGVVLDTGTQTMSVALSYGYALRAIEGGNSLLAAQGKGVNSLPPGAQRLDPVLDAVYASVLEATDPTLSPSNVQKALASQLDNCGP